MRYFIISDLHGSIFELYELLDKLGCKWDKDRGVYVPPADTQIISVGDIVSRGWSSYATYGFCFNMVKAGYMKMVIGNHENKILRYYQGRKVQLLHGDDKTVAEFKKKGVRGDDVVNFLSSLPYFLSLDEGKLVISHAAWRPIEGDDDCFSKAYRTWSLFGPTKGTLENGMPDRIDWAKNRVINEESPIIVCGHQPVKNVRLNNKVYQIDTGCVFGGKLSCAIYPEMEIVQVNSHQSYEKECSWLED